MHVKAYLGLGSRYSYLASTQLARIQAETGATFEWVPVQSAALIRRSRPSKAPVKGGANNEGSDAPSYRDTDVRRWSAYYGIPYCDPDLSALPSDALALACWCVPDLADRRDLMIALYDAIFVEGAAVDMDRLCAIASGFGVSRTALAKAIEGGAPSVRHEQAILDALQCGAFGVPTFCMGDQLFWGNDRLPLLERHLSNVRALGAVGA